MLFLKILIVIGIIATIFIMINGISSMGKRTKDNKSKSNIMMRYRIIAQALTLVLVLLYIFLNEGA